MWVSRMDEPGFSLILDGIYDAAITPDRLPIALERLGRAFGCNYVGLIDRNLRTGEGRATALGVDLSGQREYFEVWSERDILRQRTRAYRPGAVQTDRDILPRSDFLRSDYYNGFMKPRDMHAYMRMTLANQNGLRTIISLSRPASLGDFDGADVKRCGLLMPHLLRAARVTRRVEESNLVFNALSGVLEQSATGVLLLDRSGKVLFANTAARAIAKAADGFLLRRERIAVLNSQDNMALQRLIAGATGQSGRTDAARGGVMRVTRKSGQPALSIAAAPLPNETSLTEMGPVAFVLVTDPDANSTRPEGMIRQLFGLSAAETRVAERLMMGDSPEQAAAILDIKTSTARWHLASLYRKTGTSRQAQLLRLLLSLPTI
jgi:DNA-binding CsgD family transcriptional regulator